MSKSEKYVPSATFLTKPTLKQCYVKVIHGKSHLGFPYWKLSGFNKLWRHFISYFRGKMQKSCFSEKINQFNFLCILDILSLEPYSTNLKIMKYIHSIVGKSYLYIIISNLKKKLNWRCGGDNGTDLAHFTHIWCFQ